MKDLSIIIVNWNCIEFTKQCIASVVATVHGIEYEVIVVDNASNDSPCAALLDLFPQVSLILSKENLGFGLANNLAAKKASGGVLLFLNPDTIVRDGALNAMFDALKTNPEAGALGCRLVNPDGSLQKSSVQSFPTLVNQFFAVDHLQRRLPDLALWGKQALYLSRLTPQPVDAVSGACLMVHADMFWQVGAFSPAYFLFAEEIDLCHAIRAAGKQVLHCASAVVLHFGGQSTKQKQDGFADVSMRESVYRFLGRTRGKPYALLFRFSLFLNAFLRLFLLTLCLPLALPVGKQRSRERVLQAWRKWIWIACWSLLDIKPGSAATGQPQALPITGSIG